MSNVAMNMNGQIVLEILLSVLLGSFGPYGNSIFNFLRNCRTVFHSSCTILNSHQKYRRVPIFPCSHQHLSFSIFF